MRLLKSIDEHFESSSPFGQYRITALERPSRSLFEIVSGLERLKRSLQGDKYASDPVTDFISEFEDLVLSEDRRSDDVLYSRHAFLDDHDCRSIAVRPSLMVSTFVNAAGTLVASIAPETWDKHAWIVPAPEWNTNKKVVKTGERIDEVFKIGRLSPRSQPRLEVGKIDERLDPAVREAVLFAYWLTMRRLSKVFTVHFHTYLAGLSEIGDPMAEDRPLCGLEIVNSRDDYKSAVIRRLRDFENYNGLDRAEFLQACPDGSLQSCENALRRTPLNRLKGRVRPGELAAFAALLEEERGLSLPVPERRRYERWGALYGR